MPLKVPPIGELTLSGILLLNSMTGIMVALFLVKKFTVGFWFLWMGFHSTCLQCQFRALEHQSNIIGGIEAIVIGLYDLSLSVLQATTSE